MRIRRTPIEFHGKRLRGNDDSVGGAGCPQPVLPGFCREQRVVIIARASRGIPADIEPWIPLVLVVKCSRGRSNRPFRSGAPRDPDPESKVVVVAKHEAVAETSILYESDIGPPDLQAGVRVSVPLALSEKDR